MIKEKCVNREFQAGKVWRGKISRSFARVKAEGRLVKAQVAREDIVHTTFFMGCSSPDYSNICRRMTNKNGEWGVGDCESVCGVKTELLEQGGEEV